MRQLHRKLSLVMLCIVLVLGSAFYLIDRISVQLYFDELSQRLNGSLAMYVANAHPLIVETEVDYPALEELANRAMVINPTAEIYLLDADGRILAHALAPDSVKLTAVTLDPILGYLDGSLQPPLKGDDPTSLDSHKVFSVFPVTDPDDNLQGYLYVVLGGAQYEAIAATVSQSYGQRMILVAILLLVGVAFLAGLLVFSVLTRPLRRLTAEVTGYTSNEFSPAFEISSAIGSRDEIDELRQAFYDMSKKIQEQVEGLKENDRLRRDLVSNVSHDLRTPLASMQGYIETLLIKGDELAPEDRRQYLEVARSHARRLGTLIEDLFELAKLDSSSMNPAFEHFPLLELVQDVLQEFELEASKKHIELHIEPPQQAVTAYADIGLIQRVLENLISNALKYTPAHGSITIAVSDKSERIGVTVADTGSGIPAADLERVFDRFYRAEQGEESLAKSSGLGLAITKRILELHGSQIRVTSELRQGTSFEFDLAVAA